MIEGMAGVRCVQIPALDKPGAGGSVHIAVPLAGCTPLLFYTLYTLLHLPPTLTTTSWTLSGLLVPQSISGSIGLRLAAALSEPLPNALGSLLQLVPPVARAEG
ncbi:hypothetical protein FB451DRAFT_1416531 [Mycena latifolia]|nr:hypothetical protein FB451DRAFT_1416531 [Mycena latifolia]